MELTFTFDDKCSICKPQFKRLEELLTKKESWLYDKPMELRRKHIVLSPDINTSEQATHWHITIMQNEETL